jgi:hypothetical protein
LREEYHTFEKEIEQFPEPGWDLRFKTGYVKDCRYGE